MSHGSPPGGGGAIFAADALLPTGWARDVLLEWDADGRWTRVQAGAVPVRRAHRAAGPLVPGMPNLHSHAFQRGFAGLAEFRSAARDDFWSWRTLMYRFAARLSPASLEVIATWLYVEMLEAGYTSVCEFHYVHHRPDGTPYAQDADMCGALLRAARRAGIGLTLLPVLYQDGGFGGAAAAPGQRRFLRTVASMHRLLERLAPLCARQGARLGLAPHSLRAVSPGALADAVAGLHALDACAPVHVHIAEQRREVEDCVAWSGQRPVAWLLEHLAVDARWCLVHATHLDARERRLAARSGAVAGLCPATEANLGDGVFDFLGWQRSRGAWGIGSDSHICVDPAEELLMLEYAQRLTRRARNVAANAVHTRTADALWLGAVAGGARASARAVSGLQAGERADFMVLDAGRTPLAGLSASEGFAGYVFAASREPCVASVWQGGVRHVVRGRHALHDDARAAFIATRASIIRESS